MTAASRQRSSKGCEERVPILLRLPKSVVTWLDERAASAGVSRNQFVQMVLGDLKDPFKPPMVPRLVRCLHCDEVYSSEPGAG